MGGQPNRALFGVSQGGTSTWERTGKAQTWPCVWGLSSHCQQDCSLSLPSRWLAWASSPNGGLKVEFSVVLDFTRTRKEDAIRAS